MLDRLSLENISLERVSEGLTQHVYSFMAQPSFAVMGLWAALAATVFFKMRLASLPKRDKSQAIVVGRIIHKWTGWLKPLHGLARLAFLGALAFGLSAVVVQTGVAMGKLPATLSHGP